MYVKLDFAHAQFEVTYCTALSLFHLQDAAHQGFTVQSGGRFCSVDVALRRYPGPGLEQSPRPLLQLFKHDDVTASRRRRLPAVERHTDPRGVTLLIHIGPY